MPDPLPKLCRQCGRRPEESTTTVRAAWKEQDEELCPLCFRDWAKVGPNKVQGRCAGCGRRTDALTAGVCGKCTGNGVAAPTLFDRVVM